MCLFDEHGCPTGLVATTLGCFFTRSTAGGNLGPRNVSDSLSALSQEIPESAFYVFFGVHDIQSSVDGNRPDFSLTQFHRSFQAGRLFGGGLATTIQL
jgi:hypothetical protein